jgi:uncharacterized damage-inducible protein DinB
MKLKDALLAEFDLEMATTRRVLERVPADAIGWKPHPKSTALESLAGHIADLPFFATSVATMDRFDFAAAGRTPTRFESQAQLLGVFDANVRDARAALEALDEGVLGREYRLQFNGQTVAAGPKHLMLRTLFMNHVVHHRAQLTVYLRLRDVPVPSVYGPSADEPFAMAS